MRYGAYAHDAHARSGLARPARAAASRVAEPADTRATVVVRRVSAAASLPTGILGAYDLNGSRWAGRLLPRIAQRLDPDTQVYCHERGFWEGTANRTWDASTGTLALVRPLSGGVTQTYVLYIGTQASARASAPAFQKAGPAPLAVRNAAGHRRTGSVGRWPVTDMLSCSAC